MRGERADVARQRAAREGAARPEVGPRPDPRLALERRGDLTGIGADALADGGDLVDERHRRREERVERVLGHLGRLDAHPRDLIGDRREQPGDHLLAVGVADADDDAIRLQEDVDGLAQPEVLGRVGQRDAGRRVGLQQRRRADGQLRGDEDDGAVVQQRQQRADAVQDVVDVRVVVGVDRRVVGDPDQLRATHRLGGVGDRAQAAVLQPVGDHLLEAGLEQRRDAARQVLDDGAVGVVRGDVVADRRQRGGRHGSEVPQSGDADSHGAVAKLLCVVTSQLWTGQGAAARRKGCQRAGLRPGLRSRPCAYW